LKPGCRAGLVGTNTIRQNYSREGGLDQIVAHGGTITEAVASQPWSGEANVHVSIVNWIHGDAPGKKMLMEEIGTRGNTITHTWLLDRISSSLSAETDSSDARTLSAARDSRACYQGQTHGHEGFLLDPTEAQRMIQRDPQCVEVLFPYLTADELFSSSPPRPGRWVIDFHPRDVLAAGKYKEPFQQVRHSVLPTREAAAKEEEVRNQRVLAEDPRATVNRHHANFLRKWWLLSYPREEMIQAIGDLKRFVVCGQVTKRPIFEFISPAIRPNAALIVFPLADDYSFGIFQSDMHWRWFTSRCSTLTERFRYTSNTVFDTFPWPQSPTLKQAQAVAEAAVQLRSLRRRVMAENGWSLRDLYRTLETPGANPLNDVQDTLDAAVRAAYGMKKAEDVLAFLLRLNHEVATREERLEPVVGPGLPPCVSDSTPFITDDCIDVD
jgi:hypothetical protein